MVESVQMSPGQKKVEDLFERIKDIPVDKEKSAVAQFGEMESWMFTLGEYTLFLNPLTRSWYFFDRPHNDWKDLKAPVGSVVFQLVNTDLKIHNISTIADCCRSRSVSTTPFLSPVWCPGQAGIEVLQQLRRKDRIIFYPYFVAKLLKKRPGQNTTHKKSGDHSLFTWKIPPGEFL